MKKFSILTFNYYCGESNPVQYIRHFRDKMVVQSRNDPLIYLTFMSSLKGVVSDWFNSLPPCSLHSFEEVIEAFLI